MNREFLIDIRSDGAHVLLAGEIDMLAAPAVSRAIERALRMRVRSVVMNLDSVTFIDSGGLSALAGGGRRAVRAGMGFRISPAATPAVARVLDITGMDKLVWEATAPGDVEASGQ
jgi:anti-sigma B factor antagonist